MRMAVIALVVLSFGWNGGDINAKDAARRALAEELLNEMDMKGTLETTFAMVRKMMPSQMKTMRQAMEKDEKLSAEAAANADAMRAKMEKVTAKAIDEMAQEMSWEKLKDDYIAIYAETYTEEELRGLVAFYSSPAGRAFTKKQPELTQRSMQLAQKQMFEWLPKIRAMTKEAMEAGTPLSKAKRTETKEKEPSPVPVPKESAQ